MYRAHINAESSQETSEEENSDRLELDAERYILKTRQSFQLADLEAVKLLCVSASLSVYKVQDGRAWAA